MKLKKIASLALAGIMAVSMLAGCKDGGNGNSGSSSSGNTSTASGYSTVLKNNLSSEVTNKKYISFADNANDEAALRAALENVSDRGIDITLIQNNNLKNIYTWNTDGFEEMIADFVKEAGFDDPSKDIKPGDLSMSWYTNDAYRNYNVKDGTLYVIDGSVGIEEAVKRVAAEVEDSLAALAENSGKGAGNAGLKNVYDYSYVVSVSVVNKPTNSITWQNASINVIAVTVTRTVSNG